MQLPLALGISLISGYSTQLASAEQLTDSPVNSTVATTTSASILIRDIYLNNDKQLVIEFDNPNHADVVAPQVKDYPGQKHDLVLEFSKTTFAVDKTPKAKVVLDALTKIYPDLNSIAYATAVDGTKARIRIGISPNVSIHPSLVKADKDQAIINLDLPENNKNAVALADDGKVTTAQNKTTTEKDSPAQTTEIDTNNKSQKSRIKEKWAARLKASRDQVNKLGKINPLSKLTHNKAPDQSSTATDSTKIGDVDNNANTPSSITDTNKTSAASESHSNESKINLLAKLKEPSEGVSSETNIASSSTTKPINNSPTASSTAPLVADSSLMPELRPAPVIASVAQTITPSTTVTTITPSSPSALSTSSAVATTTAPSVADVSTITAVSSANAVIPPTSDIFFPAVSTLTPPAPTAADVTVAPALPTTSDTSSSLVSTLPPPAPTVSDLTVSPALSSKSDKSPPLASTSASITPVAADLSPAAITATNLNKPVNNLAVKESLKIDTTSINGSTPSADSIATPDKTDLEAQTIAGDKTLGKNDTTTNSEIKATEKKANAASSEVDKVSEEPIITPLSVEQAIKEKNSLQPANVPAINNPPSQAISIEPKSDQSVVSDLKTSFSEPTKDITDKDKIDKAADLEKPDQKDNAKLANVPANPLDSLTDAAISNNAKEPTVPAQTSTNVKLKEQKAHAGGKDYFPPKFADDAIEHYNAAVHAHLSGKLTEAITEYKAAIEADDKIGEAYSNLGLIYNQLHKYDLAMDEFHKALAINPKDAITYNGIGAAMRAKNNLLAAIKNWQTAITMDPNLASAHYNLGTAYELNKDLEKALAQYKEAVKYDDKLGEAYYRMGLILQKMNNKNLALEEYKQAIKISEQASYVSDAKKRINLLSQSKNNSM